MTTRLLLGAAREWARANCTILKMLALFALIILGHMALNGWHLPPYTR